MRPIFVSYFTSNALLKLLFMASFCVVFIAVQKWQVVGSIGVKRFTDLRWCQRRASLVRGKFIERYVDRDDHWFKRWNGGCQTYLNFIEFVSVLS